jgi:predicted DNA-binding transcriptional regulator AlpA
VNTHAANEGRVYLTVKDLQARYSVSRMTLHRWGKDPALNFPKPVYLGSHPRYRASDLDAWEATRPTTPAVTGEGGQAAA